MKKKYSLLILIILFLEVSCSYKPLYIEKNFNPHEIKVIVKQKEKYGNNMILMKSLLEKKFNSSNSKPSNLKLIMSVDIKVSNLGVNKDLNTFGKKVTISTKYTMYDKIGMLTSGNLSNSSTFNFSSNDYGNITSLEDSYSKLVKNTSEDIANLILAENFKRNIIP